MLTVLCSEIRFFAKPRNVSGNQAVGHHKDKSTHTATAQKQKTSFLGQLTAKMQLSDSFSLIVFCTDHTATARAINKDNCVFKATSQKADARLFLKVLVLGHQTKSDFLI